MAMLMVPLGHDHKTASKPPCKPCWPLYCTSATPAFHQLLISCPCLSSLLIICRPYPSPAARSPPLSITSCAFTAPIYHKLRNQPPCLSTPAHQPPLSITSCAYAVPVYHKLHICRPLLLICP
eukprot:1158240-Pelagomonas_calceolata.AAC.2